MRIECARSCCTRHCLLTRNVLLLMEGSGVDAGYGEAGRRGGLWDAGHSAVRNCQTWPHPKQPWLRVWLYKRGRLQYCVRRLNGYLVCGFGPHHTVGSCRLFKSPNVLNCT